MARKISKKTTKPKTLRMDKKMANDLVTLSRALGRTQNYIIYKAIRQCFFDNRQYFVGEIIREIYLSPIEYDVMTKHEDSNMEQGNMAISFKRTDDAEVYTAHMSIKNKHDEILVEDSRKIHIHTKDWEDYQDYIIEQFSPYIDLDDEGVMRYCYERFSYE